VVYLWSVRHFPKKAGNRLRPWLNRCGLLDHRGVAAKGAPQPPTPPQLCPYA
jgi:hypothetical protein